MSHEDTHIQDGTEAIDEVASAEQKPLDAAPEINAENEAEAAAISSLEQQLAAAKKEAQDNLEGRQRTLAEFQNYKRRVERETAEIGQKAAVDVLSKLLPIVDDFERGMENIPEDIVGSAWLDGITLVQRKFQKLLDEYNIVVINPVGEPFDPSRHEAVGVEENTAIESGHVAAILQKGYMYGEKVLRPALVRVAG